MALRARASVFSRSSLRSASSPRLPAGGPAADVTVILDQAKLMKLPEKVATIVIGNPLIADASLQTGGLMVITGKGYGVTNIIALDRTGTVLMDKTIEVQGPRGQRGRRLSRRRARDLQLHAELRAADHARRRQHLLRYRASCRSAPAPASAQGNAPRRSEAARLAQQAAASWLAKPLKRRPAVIGNYHNNSTTSLCYCSTVRVEACEDTGNDE